MTATRVVGILLLLLRAGAETGETDDCAMTQLRGVVESNKAGSEIQTESTRPKKKKAKSHKKNTLSSPCDDLTNGPNNFCQKNRGRSYNDKKGCSFNCKGAKAEGLDWNTPGGHFSVGGRIGLSEEAATDASDTTQTCPRPCLKETAAKWCRQKAARGRRAIGESCSFSCSGKGQLKSWQGPKTKSLVAEPCDDLYFGSSLQGPSAWCMKNRGQSYDGNKCSFKCTKQVPGPVLNKLTGRTMSADAGNPFAGSCTISLSQMDEDEDPAEDEEDVAGEFDGTAMIADEDDAIDEDAAEADAEADDEADDEVEDEAEDEAEEDKAEQVEADTE